MRRRGARGSSTREDRRLRDSADYYVSSDSDRRYAQQVHERLGREARRRWMLRLAVLAVVAFVVWMWGPEVVRALRVEAHMTTQEFKDFGERVRTSTDERTGAGLAEEETR